MPSYDGVHECGDADCQVGKGKKKVGCLKKQKAKILQQEEGLCRALEKMAVAAPANPAQQLQAELAAERLLCARLMEELAALQRHNAQVGQSESAKVAALQKQVEMLTAEKASVDEKLETASKAQRAAQSQLAALGTEVSMLEKMLADAKADGQKRLDQLEAKLTEAERAKKELAEQVAEKKRELEEESKHRAAVLAKAATAQKVVQRSKEDAEKALAAVQSRENAAQQAVQGRENAAQQLQAELAAERLQCARLMEELAALQRQNAQVGQRVALQKQVEMPTAEKAAESVGECLQSTVVLAELRNDLNAQLRVDYADYKRQTKIRITDKHQNMFRDLFELTISKGDVRAAGNKRSAAAAFVTLLTARLKSLEALPATPEQGRAWITELTREWREPVLAAPP